MMRRLLVVGAGGHGKVVADAALATRQWSEVAFIDDNVPAGISGLNVPVLGPAALLPSLRDRFCAAVVAIGSAQTRLRLLGLCRSTGFELPVIVHPSASVSSFATLEDGTVVCAQGVVNPGAELGLGCIVNTAASVDHDCLLGEGVHVCPGARLAGNVRIGAGTCIGLGACVRQGIEIGSDVVVAAGAVVVSNVISGMTVMGVPARSRSAK